MRDAWCGRKVLHLNCKVNILVVILYHNFARCYHWPKLHDKYMRLPHIILYNAYESIKKQFNFLLYILFFW